MAKKYKGFINQAIDVIKNSNQGRSESKEFPFNRGKTNDELKDIQKFLRNSKRFEVVYNDYGIFYELSEKQERPWYDYVILFFAVVFGISTWYTGCGSNELAQKQIDITNRTKELEASLDSTQKQLSIQKAIHKSFVDSIQNVEGSLQD